MNYYAALDVSLWSVHLCVVDDAGELIAETKLSSEVTDIRARLEKRTLYNFSGGAYSSNHLIWINFTKRRIGCILDAINENY